MALAPKEITQLANELEHEFYGAQQAEDRRLEQILQRKSPTASGHKNEAVQRISTGYAALTVMQSFSLLTQPPFAHVKSPTTEYDKDAEKVESALSGWASRYYSKVWIPGVYDFVWAGRAFWCVWPDPSMWGGDRGFSRYDDEPETDYLKRVKSMKENVTPIRWRHADVRNTWPTFDDDDSIDQVVERFVMRTRNAKTRYNIDIPDKKDREMVTLYRYTDQDYTCTVLALGKDDQRIVHEYEHGLGVNPFVMARAPLQAPLDDGMLSHGALYHTKDIMDVLDSLISDVNYTVKEDVRSKYTVTLSQDRPPGPDGALKIDLNEPIDKPVRLVEGETLGRMPPVETNMDVWRLFQALQSITQTTAITPVLLGLLGSDQSGVLYNTAAQYAQRQYGPATAVLEEAAKGIARRWCRSVYKGLGEPVTVYADSGAESLKHTVTPKLAETFENRIQTTINVAVAINENAQAEQARLLTDPANQLMSIETAQSRFLHIADAYAENERIAENQLERALAPIFVEFAKQALTDEMNDPGDLADLAGLDQFGQQVIAGLQNGNGGGQLARTAANTVRRGVPQNPTDIEAAQLQPEANVGPL